MLHKNNSIKYLAGNKNIKKIISEPFSDLSLEFLDELSKNIFKLKLVKKYKDLVTFAFWCRRKNLEEIKKDILDNKIRLGLGILFHVTPANVPITFIYSFVFGLLAGNSNIVRVNQINLEQVDMLIEIIKKIFSEKRFKNLRSGNLFISYEKNNTISDTYSSMADGRIIWGGDNTINEFKKKNTHTNCIDLFFGDKYSICLLNSKKIKSLNKKKMNNFVENFYNDVFIMDQNACSSPHLILWEKNPDENSKIIFWKNLEKLVQKKYLFTNDISSKKFKILNQILLNNNNFDTKNFKSKLVYNIKLKKINNGIEKIRGFSGIFFEYDLNKTSELKKIVNRKFQTLTYFGYTNDFLKKLILDKKIGGIDRIVPVGKALEINLIWDGFNVIDKMSRIIDIR